MKLFEFYNSSVIIFIEILDISLSGIFIGSIVGYLTNYYFISKKQLSYQYYNTTYFIDEKYPLSHDDNFSRIRYRKKNELIRTFLVIWNSGNSILEEKDISKSMPLVAKGFLIKGISPVSMTRPSNNVEAILKDSEVKFSFEYLKPNDGFVIQIIHLSKFLKVKGDVKASKSYVVNCVHIKHFSGKRAMRITSIFLFGVAIFFAEFYLKFGHIHAPWMKLPPDQSYLGIYANLLLGMYFWREAKRSFPNKLKFDKHKIYYLTSNETEIYKKDS